MMADPGAQQKLFDIFAKSKARIYVPVSHPPARFFCAITPATKIRSR
jgi:hypothetical protein